MAQQQVTNYSGFTSSNIQVDNKLSLKIINHTNPHMELCIKDSKFVITRSQWNIIQQLTNNINIAFSLLDSGHIQEISKKRHIDNSVQEIFDELGL